MEIAGYLAAVFIGVSLGLIGGGGSILTVPVLVYLFYVDTVLATTYSLFVVGITSVVGSFSYFKKGLVQLKTAVVFGIPSILLVFITRAFVVPAIPNTIFQLSDFVLTKDMLLMLLFAILMIFASLSMIRNKNKTAGDIQQNQPLNYPIVFAEGIFVGIITGLIGAGGGFLIIPVLVNILKLPMKTAIGTSLVIISVNSLLGFLFSLHHIAIDWIFLLAITSIAITGVLIGSYLSTKIDGKKLKPAFGLFVLIMGIYILIKEIFFN